MLDSYYTPKEVAYTLLMKANFNEPQVCVDPTCGSGNLLFAASNIYENAELYGIDIDPKSVNKLKKLQPGWKLSVANFLKSRSVKSSKVLMTLEHCDLLLLNPPFSQIKSKFVVQKYSGEETKVSIGMSYLLKSLELFKPKQGAIVIAPESLLYSELDARARFLLSLKYDIEILQDLENKTFEGATVHSVAFKLIPNSNTSIRPQLKKVTSVSNLVITRGGLQVHKQRRENCINGIRFIHSTDINNIIEKSEATAHFTNYQANGRIIGKALLLPRVGLPKLKNIKQVTFNEQVQLSDCVIAIQCEDIKSLNLLCKLIHDNWESFMNLYKGTGAKYITLSRLKEWLIINGAHVSN